MKAFRAWAQRHFFKLAMALAYALFGREVTIEGRPDKVKIAPLVWKGRLHLLGLNGDEVYTGVEFTSGSTLRLVKPPLCPAGPAFPITAPLASCKIAHVLVSHLPAPITDGLLDYAGKMNDRYDLILGFGGKPEEFAQVRFQDKIFIQDEAMRGSLDKINLDELLQSLWNHYQGKPRPDWIFVGDYDTLPLRYNYLDASVTAALAHKKTFVGWDMKEVTASNCSFITRATLDYKLGWLARDPAERNMRIYQGFGAAFLFTWDCLEGMLRHLGHFPRFFHEIGMPSSAVLAGHQIMSMETAGREWEGIRYRPVYPLAELERFQSEGISMLHPVKDLANFLKVSDAFCARARAAASRAG